MADHFNHPDPETVARVLLRDARHPQLKSGLHFNYRSERNSIRDDQMLKIKYGYTTFYPADDHAGLVVSL
jgi:hypothetical protein